MSDLYIDEDRTMCSEMLRANAVVGEDANGSCCKIEIGR